MPPNETPTAPVKVVALSGSARPGSYTRMALTAAARAASGLGAQVTFVDLAEWRLPPFDNTPATEKEHPEVQRLKATFREGDALLIATPVYHDSYSGILKNAIDFLYAAELGDRLAGLIAVGGGKVGHSLALEHLRTVLREVGSWVLPRQVLVSGAQDAFNATGEPTDPEVAARLTALGQELVLRVKSTRMRPRR